MPESTQAMALGLQYHRSGNLHEAERIYLQVLQTDSSNADAMLHLGAVYMAQGRFKEAAANLQQVIRLRPHSAEPHSDLGVAFAQLGNTEQAVASFRRALQIKPNYPEAHNNLGIVLTHHGNLEEGIGHYLQALQLRPDYAEAHNNLGVALGRQGRLSEAIASYSEALRLRPDYADAHNNLGLALAEQGNWDAAITSYREALRLRPHYPEAHYNLGLVFAKVEKLDEAVGSYQQALRLKPDYVEAHNNLGAALATQGQVEQALASFRQALQLKPDYAEAYYNQGWVLAKHGKQEEAIDCYQQALRLKPDYPEAHKDLALAWLVLGKFEQGWPEYEWRWKCPEMPSRTFIQPRWDGSPLAGRTILLHAEQGFGDTLQFIRYAPWVQQGSGKVLVMCQPQLLRLLASCPGIDRLAAPGSPLPDFDVHAPLLGLPGIFRTTLATVPAEVPYLSADPLLVEQWRRDLDPFPGFKVGIAWQGNPKHRQDRQRSVPLACFEPLVRLPGVRLFGLQVGPGAEQLPHIGFPVIDLGSRFDPMCFQDAAAAMMTLDLVVSVDSAMAHLAGALGVPVWTLLPSVPDWRWLLRRDDSPWYPTMRLFRQKEPGDWDGVFDRIVGAVAQRLSGEGHG